MGKKTTLKHSTSLDRIGVFVSTLCIIHCILFPLLIILIPTTRGLFNDLLIEGTLLFLGIVVGCISFVSSFKIHKNTKPLMIGLSGIALLTIDLFVLRGANNHFDLFGFLSVQPLMILGGVLLLVGHVHNLRNCKEHCHHP